MIPTITVLLLFTRMIGQGPSSAPQAAPAGPSSGTKVSLQSSDGEASAADDAAGERDRRLDLMKLTAERYEIYISPERRKKLSFRKEPLLRWNNPVRFAEDGATFIWTDEGRPKAAACIYISSNATPERVLLDHEFQSLCTDPLVARRDGQDVWYPTKPGIDPKRFTDVRAPAKSSAGRLIQMRRLAREFSAAGFTQTTGGDMRRWELRLLPRPLYRFGSDKGEVIDGALFAFVQSTDPELLLLLEVRQDGDQRKWSYALARMTSHPLEARYKDRVIWEVAYWPWQRVNPDPTGPYITFIDMPTTK